MNHHEIKAQVLVLPEVAAWPQMAELFERTVTGLRPSWEWSLLACQAVGGDIQVMTAGAAALACLMLSIILVDDMLDADPRGAHFELGEAATANLAFAFQSAAFRLIANMHMDTERRMAVLNRLAGMTLTTAFGQSLDVQKLVTEENYWQVVKAKSSPFYGALLYVGALLGQAQPEVAERLHELGLLCGEIIQIQDDLIDALQKPANPDWKHGRNLMLLYALTADHAEREPLLALMPQTDNPQVLDAAQKILIRCGAVSYGAYHIVSRYLTARQLLDKTPLSNPDAMRQLLGRQVKPLVALLHSVGAEIPPELEGIGDERSSP